MHFIQLLSGDIGIVEAAEAIICETPRVVLGERRLVC